MVRFADRVDAGRRLAEELERFREEDVVVLGLPRGGVPVAAEVARALGKPLDVIVVRKLGVPFQPELAMGAIGEGDVRVLDDEVIRLARITDKDLHDVEARERAELDDRVERFRRGRPRLDLTGRVALVVDDGIATGSTAKAACRVARQLGAARVVMATPVAPPDTVARFHEADEVVTVQMPQGFSAVGQFYRDFRATTDDTVVELLHQWPAPVLAGVGDPPIPVDEDVRIPVGNRRLEGHLSIPVGAPGVVLFAHGSGSSRHSPRNRYVAEVLQAAGLGTLLMDLLTVEEERDRTEVFDIEKLAWRLEGATDWLVTSPEMDGRKLGYFGASTGAAAALWAAAAEECPVAAVVSRGGRPDLAGPRLPGVRVPTLLIVGGADTMVLELNRQAQSHLTCTTSLAVVPGATHLFEEPGTLAEAAVLARDWFLRYLGPDQPATGPAEPS